MRRSLVLIMIAACSGMPGVTELETTVAATHCQDHACSSEPAVRNLGEGCYEVDDLPYQCTTDALPGGQPACFEVSRCTGMCSSTVTFNGHETSTDRCRERWAADRRARRGPRPCSPALLLVVLGEGGPAMGSELPLPATLVTEVIRSGKSRVQYVAEACATEAGVVVGEPTHATGFPDLDEVLRGEAAEVDLPAGACAAVTMITTRFECEVDQSA